MLNFSSYDETDEDCLSPNIDEVTATEQAEESSVEESTLSEQPPTSTHASDPGFVNLSSIYSIGSERWGVTPGRNGIADRRSEKPVPPEKPVSLMMVNGKTDNRYADFGNNSFLYGARAKEPPSYTAATAALFERGATSPPAVSPTATTPVNKISDNYERAVAERLSPGEARLNRSALFGRVHTGVVAGSVRAARAQDDDEDYARDSDECSI